MSEHQEISRRLDAALDVALDAARSTLRYFQDDQLVVDLKADDSPVTVADREAEQRLRERIEQRFPSDGIVGEEFGTTDGSSDFRWILDPIDGTKSFISGVPLFATLVGIEQAGRAVVGVIVVPGLHECAFAATDLGAWHRRGSESDRKCQVSDRPLGDGLFVTSQVDSFAARNAFGAFEQLQSAARLTRTWGDAYGYLLVATGRAEVMVDPVMNLWDAAAIAPILDEAGGSFTDWQGRATIHSGEGVGTNQAARDEVLEITRAFPKPD